MLSLWICKKLCEEFNTLVNKLKKDKKVSEKENSNG